jgi:hypothetical protein
MRLSSDPGLSIVHLGASSLAPVAAAFGAAPLARN